ncbi:phospholipid-transporting ATPase FetA-like [Sorex araneus]|uniref:phospholipid-transporting ATPase FetA-like n=1 Tax=Sorex araneus TaxID=42254 RepID=UPI002433B58A|nr:phospholipid-transporting ATPase FetA-like [Sorex araneus]
MTYKAVDDDNSVLDIQWPYSKPDTGNNTIKTSRYNFFNFLPLNLFEQFQRIANAYFLILLILQLIPQISSLAWYTTVIPLMVVLTITAVKDASDDVKRHKNDKQVNSRSVLVLMNGKIIQEKWMNIQVGDIIKLENNNLVPADILLLSSSEPCGLTYIETAELDGETNLKVKQAITVTAELEGDMNLLSTFDGEVNCEAPNNKLDRFTGTLNYEGKSYFLNYDRMILRGCVIRNTTWCYGLVIFTGPDTKLMQNSESCSFKRTHMDHLMNILVLWIFLILACMCIILAIGHGTWETLKGYQFQGFLPWQRYVSSSAVSAMLIFWSYFIILNTMVPISLYVSVEIIRLGNSYYINWDRKMYCVPKNIPARARTTTLNEELGQVQYIFSDKTGTLTQNIMVFSKCSINGISYGADKDEVTNTYEKTEKINFSFSRLADPNFSFHDKSLAEAIQQKDRHVCLFFLSLSLCHTVMVEEEVEDKLVYQAQSPDEGALVSAARNFGFVFRSRTHDSITVVEMGETKVYQLLAILDFNNVRKRMSVIVRTPENRVMLFCKGADTIICQLLHPSCKFLRDVTIGHLDNFASDGLRTLMVAYRELDDAFYEAWNEKHNKAFLSWENRENEIEFVYEEIEKELVLLGATAIEDKLQEHVPETIISLNKANIKIWILTGDKQETAVNIAYACRIFEDDMDGIFTMEGNDYGTVRQELRSARVQMKIENNQISNSFTVESDTSVNLPDEFPKGKYGLVITGCSLAHALEGDMELELLELACLCKGVICCRMTPHQKAQMVELVKRYKKVVTLAIGDGANDVNMIKAADIGVGICGQEGTQAMLSSDFSFGQFHYLRRLLLVHGRWSYIRMCKFLSYFFYKNFAFTVIHFWYAFFSGFSAQAVYDTWFIAFYNLIYTSLPVLGLCLFDQDVNETWSLHFPELYEPGQFNLYFNKTKFVKCLIHGIYSSLVLFFIPLGTTYNTVNSDGKDVSDYQSFSLMVQTSLLSVVTVQIALETTCWTMISHVITWGSLGFYFCLSFLLYSDGLYLLFPSFFQYLGVARNTMKLPQMWLSLILCIILCTMPFIGYQFLKSLMWPINTDMVFERIRHRMKERKPRLKRTATAQTGIHRSAYAFSHTQGFGALITSGKTEKSKKNLDSLKK